LLLRGDFKQLISLLTISKRKSGISKRKSHSQVLTKSKLSELSGKVGDDFDYDTKSKLSKLSGKVCDDFDYDTKSKLS